MNKIYIFVSIKKKAGSNGMGQAQSQSSGGDCGDCTGGGDNYFNGKNISLLIVKT